MIDNRCKILENTTGDCPCSSYQGFYANNLVKTPGECISIGQYAKPFSVGTDTFDYIKGCFDNFKVCYECYEIAICEDYNYYPTGYCYTPVTTTTITTTTPAIITTPTPFLCDPPIISETLSIKMPDNELSVPISISLTTPSLSTTSAPTTSFTTPPFMTTTPSPII